MKEIYIVLTYTGTILSRIIKIYTKKRYSHVSISLDKKLEKMYSFGRLNAYNAFVGGFVRESIQFGTFKRFKKADTLIYKIEITEEQYFKLEEKIQYFHEERKKFKFNTIGLFLAGFDRKLERENYLYCAEFVKKVIEESNIDLKLPEIIKPDDFTKIENAEIIYQGRLCDYNLNE